MNRKIEELSAKIRSELTPLIVSDYVLWDCPYHGNIGDVLIWRGEQSFLEGLPYRCLDQSSMMTYREDIELSPSTTILLHGGGNFGDVWRKHSEFRLRIIEQYPDNKVIILPQTVQYSDMNLLESDAALFARHENVTICARDNASYALLSSHFKNRILLLPDMAFCIDTDQLQRWSAVQGDKVLYLERTDRELLSVGERAVDVSRPDVEVHDWPTLERGSREVRRLKWRLRILRLYRKFGMPKSVVCRLSRSIDNYAATIFMDSTIRYGVEFISRYKKIYSTRLHGAILAMLLERECTMLDNNYGKNSSFKKSWLDD